MVLILSKDPEMDKTFKGLSCLDEHSERGEDEVKELMLEDENTAFWGTWELRVEGDDDDDDDKLPNALF
jgi:hypothetical protein